MTPSSAPSGGRSAPDHAFSPATPLPTPPPPHATEHTAADALSPAAPTARPLGNRCDGAAAADAVAAAASASAPAPAPAAVPSVPRGPRRARTAATALAGSRRVRRVRDVLRAITARADGCATCTRVDLRTTRYTRGRPYA